jgi:hypothetical protein
MFYREVPITSGGDEPPDVDVLLALDHMQFAQHEQVKIARWSRDVALIWIGVPSGESGPEFRDLFFLPDVEIDMSNALRRLDLRSHAITRDLDWPEEQHLRFNHQEHVITRRTSWPSEAEEVATISFVDGVRLGPGILAISTTPRRVFMGFPLGKLVATNTSTHGWVRSDLRGVSYPLYVTIDVLRAVLRNMILWCVPDKVLVRKAYWPVVDGSIPQGCFLLNHDLCNWAPEGGAWIRQICGEYGIVTTFFDPPFSNDNRDNPFRLTKETAGGHDVALHLADDSTAEEFAQARAELERVHGRPVLGWGRHGPTNRHNYPQVWRNAVAAGFKWARTFAIQTNLELSLSEATGTGDRLPHKIIDMEAGEEIQLWELPSFDSQDGERDVNFDYGGGLDWPTWLSYVTRRMDFTQKHSLGCGFLLHGGGAALPPAGHPDRPDRHVYVDNRRMARATIEMAKERGFVIWSHSELYEWWIYREAISGDISEHGLILHLLGTLYTGVLELFSAGNSPPLVRVNGGRLPIVTRMTPAKYATDARRWFLPLVPDVTGQKAIVTLTE